MILADPVLGVGSANIARGILYIYLWNGSLSRRNFHPTCAAQPRESTPPHSSKGFAWVRADRADSVPSTTPMKDVTHDVADVSVGFFV